MIQKFTKASIFRKERVVVRRIFVDVSNIARSDARTGIQRVVRAILAGLADLPQGITLHPVYATSKRGFREIKLNGVTGSRIARLMSRRVNPAPGDIFLALDLNAHMLPRHEPQIVTWRSLGVKTFFVVYDLLPSQHPEWFTDRAVSSFQTWLGLVHRTADEIICISNSVSHQVKIWLAENNSVSGKKVSVVRLGSDIAASIPSPGFSSSAKMVAKCIDGSQFVLMVGTVEPRKAYELALDAFERLWGQGRRSVPLVIVGRKGWKTEELQLRINSHPKLGKDLFWLHDASDEALEFLYSKAAGLFMTSLGEGYGLPLAEARAHGLPILARDMPIFREVAGDKACYFSGENPDDVAADLEQWLDSLVVGARSECEGMPTWADTHRDIWAALGLADR